MINTKQLGDPYDDYLAELEFMPNENGNNMLPEVTITAKRNYAYLIGGVLLASAIGFGIHKYKQKKAKK